MRLLSTHWANISERFRDAILNGVADYLAHRYGNLQYNGEWKPLEEPDAIVLANHILDELERHPTHWHHNSAASSAMRSSVYVIRDTQNAARLVFLAIGFASLREERTIKEDSAGLITVGINMMTGKIAEALMILANTFQEQNIPFPELLLATLRRFAGKEHPAIRALILQRFTVFALP